MSWTMKTRWKTETGEAPILKEEVEKAVWMLKNNKSPRVDNIPAEALKHGGPGTIDALTIVSQKNWTQSLIIALAKKATHDCVSN